MHCPVFCLDTGLDGLGPGTVTVQSTLAVQARSMHRGRESWVYILEHSTPPLSLSLKIGLGVRKSFSFRDNFFSSSHEENGNHLFISPAFYSHLTISHSREFPFKMKTSNYQTSWIFRGFGERHSNRKTKELIIDKIWQWS